MGTRGLIILSPEILGSTIQSRAKTAKPKAFSLAVYNLQYIQARGVLSPAKHSTSSIDLLVDLGIPQAFPKPSLATETVSPASRSDPAPNSSRTPAVPHATPDI
jgi:hypothetical protein